MSRMTNVPRPERTILPALLSDIERPFFQYRFCMDGWAPPLSLTQWLSDKPVEIIIQIDSELILQMIFLLIIFMRVARFDGVPPVPLCHRAPHFLFFIYMIRFVL